MTVKETADRLWREANARDYTIWDLLQGDPPDLAAQITSEVFEVLRERRAALEREEYLP